MELQFGGVWSCWCGVFGGVCELGLVVEVVFMSFVIYSIMGICYDLVVLFDEMVEGLCKWLFQCFKVFKECLVFFYKDIWFSLGKLQEFGVGDGSKLILVFIVEVGFMFQVLRLEQFVM